MRLPLLFVLGCLAAFALAACKDDTNRVISAEVSPNGHSFVLMPITERGVTDITVSVAWKTDWITGQGANPWAPLIGTNAMLSGGTQALNPADVGALFDDKNARGALYSTADMILGEVEFPNNYQDDVLPVMTEMFQSPRFDPAWFQRLKDQQLDGLSGAWPLAFDMWQASRFAILGDTELTRFLNANDFATLQGLTVEDLKDWHAASFARAPVAVVVTGATDADNAGVIVDTLLGAPGTAPQPAAPTWSAAFTGPMIYLHDPSAEKSLIGLLGPMPDTRDGRDATDIVAARLFAGGAASPLFQAIRADLGATYGMTAEFANYTRALRVFLIAGEIDTEKMPQARDAILRAYADFVASPDMTLLGETAEGLANQLREARGYVSGSAGMLRELVIDGIDPQTLKTLPEDIEALTEADIVARLQTVFPAPGSLVIYAAGPDPAAFPEACVITEPAEALNCKGAE